MHPAAESLWKRLPKPVQDGIASGVDRLRGVTPPPPPHPDRSRGIRLLIGPVNYAGQGYRWARALEETGEVSARNFVHAENNVLRYAADYTVPWRTSEHSRAWQRAMTETITSDYTHVLIEANVPVLGGLFDGDLPRQIALMQAGGAKVGFIGHGTEVRLPSTHLTSTPWSHFTDSDEWVAAEKVEAVVEKNLEVIARMGLPTFVSTAGLLIDLPDAHFLGVVIDPSRWANDAPVLEGPRPRVVHAPTNPHVKGTPLIVPAARRLHEQGVIEFTQLDRIPNEEMPAVLVSTDIVLDQFRVGDYGVAACETMAGGRLVLAHVTDQVRREVQRHAGMPLPVIEATPDTLEDVLRDIAARPDHYRAVAADGPKFVRRLHDGTFSRRVLMDRFLTD